MKQNGTNAATGALRTDWASAPFQQMDGVRRLLGAYLQCGGFGQRESPFRIVTERRGARLRAYQDEDGLSGLPLLIVTAPFKRPYIWDLLPQVSVIRRMRECGLRVYLLEWIDDASSDATELGLADFADRAPAAAIRAIARETGTPRCLLAGHSLGGVFAAIYAALHPKDLAGLVLIEAPLALGESGGALARAARRAPPFRWLPTWRERVCGSMIDLLSMLSDPDAFYWEPIADRVGTLGDATTFAISTAVRRWTLDEFAPPRRLFIEVAEQLYRDDQLGRGVLRVAGRHVDISRIEAPVLAVVNRSGRVVPSRSTLDALVRVKSPVDLMTYSTERGTLLEHVAALVGPRVHAELWPRAAAWLKARS